MKRVNVDAASPAVKKFIRSLALDANGVEVTLGGNVVCRIIPPAQLSDAEKAGQLAQATKGTGYFSYWKSSLSPLIFPPL